MSCDELRAGRRNRASAGRPMARGPRDRRGLRPDLLVLEERRLMATFTVTSTLDTLTAGLPTAGTLRWAVEQADAASSASIIDFSLGAAAKTITLTQDELNISNGTYPTEIDGPIAALTIDGGGADRVFLIGPNVAATLSGLTITGGSATVGGGLFNEGHTYLTGCTISGNSATFEGGGLYNRGFAYLTGCTIGGNSASSGGGLYSGGTAELVRCTISGNSASLDGGGVFNDGPTYLYSCTISGNTASSLGGGLYNNSSEKLAGCTVSGNTAYYGGGLFNSSTAALFYCTISGNSADYGGGLDNRGTAGLSYCTVSGNSANEHAGLYAFEGTVAASDTIVAGNNDEFGASDITGPAAPGVTGGYDLIGPGGSGGISDGSNGDIVLADLTDLGLAPLADYGGPTQTMALLPYSLALGEGTNLGLNTNDQRGFPLDSPQPDIGAFQTQNSSPVVVVDSTGDGADVPRGILDLRGAVDFADISEVDTTIIFDPTVFAGAETIALSHGDLELTNDQSSTVIGGPTAPLTISGGGASGVFRIDANVTATISGLTITGGSTSGGGGLFNDGTATLYDCTVSGNSTYAGGGLLNEGTMTLDDCTISGNTAAHGGGLYNDGTATLYGCTVSGNIAGLDGGGLFSTTAYSGHTTLYDCTISGNSAGAGGGGLWAYGDAAMTDCTVSGNTAATAGGLFHREGLAMLTGCTVGGNTANYCGGLFLDEGASILNDTILAGDVDSKGASEIAGQRAVDVTGGYDLIGPGGPGGIINGADGDVVLATLAGLGLAPLANNGGPTQTRALLPGSHAINAGSNALDVQANNNPLATDERGIGFARTLGGTVDIGAYESPYLSTNTSLTSSAPADVSTYGQSVTFTAKVSDIDGGTGAPTGSVEFFDGSKDLGAGTALSGSGAAATSTFTTSTLSAATHRIRAVYKLTGDFLGSTSGAVSQVVKRATVTAVINAANKVYDGTTVATLSATTLTGVIGKDAVTLTVGSATFDNKNAGTSKKVTATGLVLAGAAAGDYRLASISATTSANITPAPLTISATKDTKVYDGTTAASAAPVVGGLKGSDTVTGLSESFGTKNVGTGKTLSVKGGFVIKDGDGGKDYTFTRVVSKTGAVTPAPLTITATKDTKVYDGTTTATAAPVVGGLKGTDTVTGLAETFDNKNVGTGKTLSVKAGFVIKDGDGGKDYKVTLVTSKSGTITAVPSTFRAANDTNLYDGTMTASASVIGGGLENTDTTAGLSETFDTKNARTGNTSPVSAGPIIGDGDARRDDAVIKVRIASMHGIVDLALQAPDVGGAGKAGNDYVGAIDWKAIAGPSLPGERYARAWRKLVASGGGGR